MLKAVLLGDMRFMSDTQTIGNLSGRKSGILLAYLMLHTGKRFTREQLSEVLWEQILPSDPLKALRHELWIIKDALAKANLNTDSYLKTDGEFVSFTKTPESWVDANAFQAAVENALAMAGLSNTAALEQAVILYTGFLLPGSYDQWTHYPREQFNDLFLLAMEQLLQNAEAEERWDLAIQYGKRILSVDPLLEAVHRALMRCLYAKGSRALAMKQYTNCQEILAREFTPSIEPMVETTELFEKIRNETFSRRGPYVPEAHNRTNKRHAARTPGVNDLRSIRRTLRSAEEGINHLINQYDNPLNRQK